MTTIRAYAESRDRRNSYRQNQGSRRREARVRVSRLSRVRRRWFGSLPVVSDRWRSSAHPSMGQAKGCVRAEFRTRGRLIMERAESCWGVANVKIVSSLADIYGVLYICVMAVSTCLDGQLCICVCSLLFDAFQWWRYCHQFCTI